MKYSKYYLSEFCRKGDLEKVKECIRQGIKPNINSNNPFFLDPIQLASKYGHLEIVKYLASLDSVDPGASNNFAIQFAFYYCHLGVVTYLISIGAYRKGMNKQIDKYVMERQILIILCLNRKLNCNFEKEIYKLFMKSY